MFSFTSAFEFDNIKQYDEDTKTVTITNAFGLGDVITTAQLESPLYYKVEAKEDQLVGWYNYITTEADVLGSFGELYLEDLKNGKMMSKGQQYKVLVNKEKVVDDYSYDCIEFLTEDQVTDYDCTKTKIGSHIETSEEWMPVTNPNIELYPNTLYKIGIFVDVLLGDKVDWKPTFLGKIIDEWAIYEGTGGIITTDGLYTIHTFTTNGSFNWTGDNAIAEVLVVAGGGAGGSQGAGGGAGGYNYTNITLSEQNYSVVVGLGGAGDNDREVGSANGTTSIFDTINTIGGGGGGTSFRVGMNGGSGGGDAQGTAEVIGLGTTGQGTDGGFHFDFATFAQGGGGGASFSGGNGSNGVGGNGGNGTANSINGTSTTYAGGGGGGADNDNIVVGVGGAGGGGDGGDTAQFATSGTDGLGGGGGGASYVGGGGGTAGDGGNGVVIIRYLTAPAPIIILNSPSSGNFTATQDLIINFTASDAINLTSVKLFVNDVLNQTNASGINNSVYLFNLGLGNGEYTIYGTATSNNSDPTNSSSIQINIDATSPTIDVETPVGTLDYNYIGNNETLNVTFTDINLDSCWYNYNETNITIVGCKTGVKNSTQFILETGNTNMTIYVNDTFGSLNLSFLDWEYKVLEINQNYNNITTEGATEQFSINFTKAQDLQVSTVDLIYDGTTNSFPYSVTDNDVVVQGSMTIPVISSDVNVSFFWNVTLDDGSSVVTFTNNQTILAINVDDCSSFTNLIYNFTQYDEENQTILTNNNTIELQINLYDTRKTSILTNFSNRFTNVNPVQFCAEQPILPTVNYSSYVIVKYFVNDTTTNESYAVEYYNILNQTITNITIPINIALYNLRTADTTKFRLTFRDEEYVLAPNILVQVHRQYIKDNDFKIVEIPLTDSNGQTMLNLVKNTIIYNFIMVNESGGIVGTFNSIAAFCADFSIGDCTINLAPDSASEEAYDYNEEFDISISSPSYDNSTEKISISFVTGDLTAKNVNMQVVRNNQFGNRSVCSDTLLSASGILSCDVSSITDTDQFLFISIFVDDELAKQDTTNLNSDILNFGTLNGAFYAFLLILILISLFAEDRKILVIALGIGWVCVISLGLMNGKFIGFTSAGIWIMVTIAILLWKLNKEESP